MTFLDKGMLQSLANKGSLNPFNSLRDMEMISGPNCSECDGDSQVTVELFGVIVPESHAGKEEGQSR